MNTLYDSSDSDRSIWDIVWSCLATIFTCTWIAVHPNISAASDTQITRILRRTGLMICALIAPEVIILWAMRQWYSARKIAQAHKAQGWTPTHGFFLQMGGFMLFVGDEASHPLQLEELEELYRTGEVDWPIISEEEIQDRSKGDTLSKGLVVLQTSWFLVQCIVRATKGLILTEMELVTLAFAVLNGVTYFFWWNKPVDVQFPIPIRYRSDSRNTTLNTDRNSKPTRSETSSINTFIHPFVSVMTSTKHAFASLRDAFRTRQVMVNLLALLHLPAAACLRIFVHIINTINGQDWDGKSRVPTFYAARPTHLITDPNIFSVMSIACAIIGTAFGAIHCIAWSFQFPSPQEQLLWRISSLIITCAPPIIVLLSNYISYQAGSFDNSIGTYNRTITAALVWPSDATTEFNSTLGLGEGLDNVGNLDRDNVTINGSTKTLPALSWGRLFRVLVRILRGIRLSTTPVHRSPAASWSLLFAVLSRILQRLILLGLTVAYIFARFTLIFQAAVALRDLSPGALQDVEWVSLIPHL